mmetsp:Transcript_13747/g.40359  ORF Transcript_13747/g.40359 Transcript_13747/m.40359 type:complete len:201 (-) Transcript_13747:256-858(-)
MGVGAASMCGFTATTASRGARGENPIFACDDVPFGLKVLETPRVLWRSERSMTEEDRYMRQHTPPILSGLGRRRLSSANNPTQRIVADEPRQLLQHPIPLLVGGLVGVRLEGLETIEEGVHARPERGADEVARRHAQAEIALLSILADHRDQLDRHQRRLDPLLDRRKRRHGRQPRRVGQHPRRRVELLALLAPPLRRVE